MSGKIFALREGEGLVELTQTRYENEELLQSLIEDHPEILAGDQINPDNPRRWLLISREMSVPLDERRGALDHFYIDQDGIPTFVEVKRGTDVRIRREVVGQMLDYAANGIWFWPVEYIRSIYDRNVLDGESVTLSDIGIEPENEEAFWQTVDMNLRSGKVRLMFVADEIPASLRTIIEYLSRQMKDTEVYGLEIKQFVSVEGMTTLVPSLVGGAAAQGKSSYSKQKYSNRNEFLDSVSDQIIRSLYENLFAFADRNGCRIGMGMAGFSLSVADDRGKSNTLLFGYGDDASNRKNCIETTFGLLKDVDSSVVALYRSRFEGMRFFARTKSANYRWQLTSASTEEEMQMLMDVIHETADKLRNRED